MLVSDRIEVCLLTETLLRSDINDNTWVWASPLSTTEFRISTLNRQEGKGGGLALIHNKEIKVKLIKQEVEDPFNSGNGKLT